MGYVGRFAPSPTGPLHAGSLVAALASWLDARAHGGRWLVRIEDIDPPRCPPGADRQILRQLEQCHLHADEPPVWQSQRDGIYAAALARLQAAGWAYPCGCTRRDIEAAQAASGLHHERHIDRPYPGTCRDGLHGKPARAWRFHTQRFEEFWQKSPVQQAQAAPFSIVDNALHWHDRELGAQTQDVAATVGDFVVRRADGLWAYQLAVVVDDAAQRITDVVRGADLADNTPRQLLLQAALGLPAPRYMHTPLVLQADGEKLSKQHGAPPADTETPAHALAALRQAAAFLRLESAADGIDAALQDWTAQWARLHGGRTKLQ
ncbi:tRNA glutamyl-Q(34) synthetase GluQRS [Comamonas humi]